jgi:hypothetical protein
MSSPSNATNATKWMSYLAEGLLAEEEVQPANPFFWCTGQQPVEQLDCRQVHLSFLFLSLYSSSQKSNFAILPAVETELKLSPCQPPWSSDCIFASHNNPYDFLNPASEHMGTEREEQTL